jgi:pfkB family carbohydrate kinase
MHIAGGLYQEICLHPVWNALLGSGGRAAKALAALGGKTTLHSYFENDQSVTLEPYLDLGIALDLHVRQSPIAFAYFHPLSTPHVEPRDIPQETAFHVKADTILRFGLVEGDAVVSARRAIFDPQGWHSPLHFSENGSHADEVALVLNAQELLSRTGTTDIEVAAGELVTAGVATVVVVKQGVRGAIVVDGRQPTRIIPAFRSPSVFKIGTGDVFSAIFAHYWGCQREDAATAAEQASLGVAYYAQYRDFPRARLDLSAAPVSYWHRGSVAVWAATDTLGRHYVLQETLHRLGELGIDAEHVRTHSLDRRYAALLVLSDGLSGDVFDMLDLVASAALPVVMLDEAGRGEPEGLPPMVAVTRDFTTALYQAAWATSTREAI